MALLRVRDKTRPGDSSRDRNLGEHCFGEPLPLKAMRRTLDEAIVYSADHARQLRVVR